MISINYQIEDAGWAIGRIGNETQLIEFYISYLHDSLKQLAESALDIDFTETQTVIFMDEPGEHRLVLNKLGVDKIDFEVRFYSDWVDWVLVEDLEYQIVINGITTLAEYKNEIRNVLEKIFSDLGTDLYKEKWINNDFPTNEFQRLNKNTANSW